MTSSSAEILLAHGADVNTCDKRLRAPLHDAVSQRDINIGVVEFLVNHGADVNAQDDKGRTPLQLLCMTTPYHVPLEAAGILLAHGADPTVQDNQGQTSITAVDRCPEMTQLLLGSPKAKAAHEEEVKAIEDGIRAGAVRFLEALRDRDLEAASPLSPEYSPSSWRHRLGEVRGEYENHTERLTSVLAVGGDAMWGGAFVERPGGEESQYLLLTLMRMPEGEWRVFSWTRTERSPTAENASLDAQSQADQWRRYRSAIFDAAGHGEDLPVFAGFSIGAGLLEAEAFIVSISGDKLRLHSQQADEYRRHIIEVDADRVKVWNYDMRELQITKGFTWYATDVPNETARTTSRLTVSDDGRVTIQHAGKTMVIDLHDGKVRTQTDGSVVEAAQVRVRLSTMEARAVEGE